MTYYRVQGSGFRKDRKQTAESRKQTAESRQQGEAPGASALSP
jgi:hypothetical protein